MSVLEVDILVLGVGPSGLYAAYHAGFRGMSVAAVDALPQAWRQITALYSEKLIFDVAGLPSVRGRDLVDNLVKQAEIFAPTYLLGEQAVSYANRDCDVQITCKSGKTIVVKASS